MDVTAFPYISSHYPSTLQSLDDFAKHSFVAINAFNDRWREATPLASNPHGDGNNMRPSTASSLRTTVIGHGSVAASHFNNSAPAVIEPSWPLASVGHGTRRLAPSGSVRSEALNTAAEVKFDLLSVADRASQYRVYAYAAGQLGSRWSADSARSAAS